MVPHDSFLLCHDGNSLICFFLIISDVKNLFLYLVAKFCVFFGEMSTDFFFGPFSLELFIFLFLSFNSLYTLDMSFVRYDFFLVFVFLGPHQQHMRFPA